jgi:hypothetical protein
VYVGVLSDGMQHFICEWYLKKDGVVQAHHKHFQNPLPGVYICSVGGLPVP